MHRTIPALTLAVALAALASAPAFAQLSNPVIASKDLRLFASNGQQTDLLGSAVAISGDRAVCGAPSHDPAGQMNAGAAWVFERTAGGWVQDGPLLALDGLADDRLGFSVAIDGDTIVAGAYRDDHPGNVGNAGSAYVFVRSGVVWVQQAKLVGSGTSNADFFGYSVAIAGDTLVVGAPADEVATPLNTGVVYVFVRNGTVWSETAVLQPNDSLAGNYFGAAVSLSAGTLVAGAPRDDDLGPFSGSAYVFVGAGATWSQQARLLASDGETTDQFGWSVGIASDVIAVGAPYYDGASLDSGEAYVFGRSGSVWAEEAVLAPVGLSVGVRAGWSVAVAGDFALVGVPDDPQPGSTAGGSARLFRRDGTSWSEETKIVHDDVRGNFGQSVALSRDKVLVGAPNDSTGLLTGQGCAYAFRLQNGPEIYCVGKTSSQGCVPSIGSNGVPSATSANPFWITADDVINNKSGLLFYGFAMENNPFQGGTLCVAPPLKRAPGQSSGGNPPPDDCSGTYAFDFNAFLQGGTVPQLVVGADVYAQWFARDPKLGTTYPVSLSNGIHFAIQP